ncbi:putative glucokinase [Phaeosphaeriaceae sp. SRC1lsM3a]|nr:putative glucokinase [Stagonospora sp. SRC1lsM3a]
MLESRVSAIARELDLSNENLASTTAYLIEQLREGLKHDGPTQIPSFVTSIPNGSETGSFLAVDLGGTNCRVCLVKLQGQGRYTMTQSKHVISQDIRLNASYKPLFAFIADRLQEFLAAHAKIESGTPNILKLGFTFSFTYISHSLSRGTVVQWDKGWNIPEALGRDPCQMLQEAIDHLSLPVRVTAITNDSVGTLMSRAYTSKAPGETLIGAIFGTGTNAAYVEHHHQISKLGVPSIPETMNNNAVMVINTEWGALCDSKLSQLPISRFDAALDSASSNPESQLLEKQISGLYLGELMRLAILSLMDGKLFSMECSEGSAVYHPYTIDTSFLSRVLADPNNELVSTRQEIATVLQAKDVSMDDARAIQAIAVAITKRSARLSGAAIAAIIIQSGRIKSNPSYKDQRITKSSSSTFVAEERSILSSDQASTTLFSKIRRLASTVFSCVTSSNHSRSTPEKERISPSLIDEPNEEHNIIDIGVDGSLYEHCPNFEQYIREALRQVPEIGIVGEARINIGLAKDGSGIGAALVAQGA